MRLFHVSERADIGCFTPRPPPSLDAGVSDDVVWAIEDRLLHNYLLPRDCPRVTAYATTHSDAADVARFLCGGAAHLVAIERDWLDRVRRARLWLYELPPATFTALDGRAHGAGYQVSRVAVPPLAVTAIDDVLDALTRRDVELRVLPDLWSLHDALAASSLQFSMIRMRHARPRVQPASGSCERSASAAA